MTKLRLLHPGLTALLCTLIMCTSCNETTTKKVDSEPIEVEYNPLVERFTSDPIGRKGSIYVEMTEAILPTTELDRYISITPKIDGEWTINGEDSKTIVFKPINEFSRGQLYTVEIELDEIYADNSDAQNFIFSFNTLAAEAIATFTTFKIENNGTYTATGEMMTRDFEDCTQVKMMTKWRGIGDYNEEDITWTHNTSGTTHNFTVKGIAYKGGNRTLKLIVGDKKAGYDNREVLSETIPNGGSFNVHSVNYHNDDEYYIEVLFSQLLKKGQDINGLIWLDGIDQEVEINGNKALIYPDLSSLGSSDKSNTNEDGQFYVTVCIDGALEASGGDRLVTELREEVVIESGDPSAEFLKGGTVIPPSSAFASVELTHSQGIPFKASYLNAVRIEVFRILESAVGSFLQTTVISDTDLSSNLKLKTARPVACQTVFLGDKMTSKQLRRTNTYSLNLYDIIEPEIGALYHIVLTYDKSMAISPCISKKQQLTKQAAKIADAARLKDLKATYDKGNSSSDGDYYDYYDDYYDDYNWSDSKNPCKDSYYYNKKSTRNLLVSDLGVVAKASNKPKMTLIVNSITTTMPIDGAKVTLKNYQGVTVGEGVTDILGIAEVNYTNGWPYYAVVSKDAQRTYIKVNPGSELSTSSFDVAGEQIKDGLRGFIWTERGVWRPGDNIHLNFALNSNSLPADHPVTIELRSPLGQLHQKQVVTKSVGGIYSFTLSTTPESQTGIWNATISVGGTTFVQRLRVEAIKPNRLKIALTFPEKVIQRGTPLNAKLHGEWLTGANAGGLDYIIETEFSSVISHFDGYDGFVFDNSYNNFETEEAPEITGTIDDDGDSTITTILNGGARSGGMLNANITTRLFEPSGEASVDVVTIPYSPYTSYVGIKPPKGARNRLDTDKDYNFEIVTVDPLGEIAPKRKVEITVYKVSWYWWWSSKRNQLASYISDKDLSPKKQVVRTSSSSGKIDYKLNINKNEWGVYYITTRDVNSGHEAAYSVYMDWPYHGARDRGSENGAMKLSVSLDKTDYTVGEQATVSFPSILGSRAIISVENGSDVLKTFPVECSEEQTKYSFEVTPDMQPNVYINVTLLQPYGSVKNDLPVRLYGIVPLMATSKESKLYPEIECPKEVLPESEMEITVSEKNGRSFAYTLALVDEGLLDLTRFRTPNPWGAFNARVALGISTWDVYNDVLGAYGGKIEQMFAIGGDNALDGGKKGSVNRFPPMVKYLGAFELGAGDEKTHTIKLPAYLGRVKVMVVAITDKTRSESDAWGSTEKSIKVRSPLMVLGSAPRAVTQGDEIIIPATLIATEDNLGTVTTTIKVDENMFDIIGEEQKKVTISKQGDKIVLFKLKVKDSVSLEYAGGRIELTSKAKGKSSTYTMDIPMRELTMPISHGNSYLVAAGKSWSGTPALYGAPGTQKIMMEVSSMVQINSSQRMQYLSKYPYGCIEQTTSAVFPILFLTDMVDLTAAEKKEADSKVVLNMNRYKTYATPDGYMGYWQGNTQPHQWGSAYALHFMAAAKLKGYTPPTSTYDNLIAAIKGSVTRWTSNGSNQNPTLTQAYQLYALALAGKSEFGAMNRLKQSNYMTYEAKWMLAAAYATAGRADIGKTIVADLIVGSETSSESKEQEAQRIYTYGSSDRSLAIQLVAISMMGMDVEAMKLAGRISKSLTSNNWMSTQTTAWCIMAIGTHATKNGSSSKLNIKWKVDGKDGNYVSAANKMIWSREWSNPKTNKVSMTNNTKGALHLRVVGSGISSGHGVPADEKGLKVTVRYTDNDGNLIDVDTLKQGTDFISEVKVHNISAEAVHSLMVTEPVASGWEIRTNVDEYLSKGVEYQDIRDDRINSYIPALRSNNYVIIKSRLNATYGGIYTLPAIRCAAMYDDKISSNTASRNVVIK